MTFARYFKLSSNCLIASGFVAIAFTGAIGLFWGCLYGSALVVSWTLDTAALRKKIPSWLLNGIILAYLPICIVDYGRFSGSFVLTAIHLVLFVATVKLVTLASDIDYVYLYFISFAQLLAASILTVDITFGLSLFVFLVSGISTLTLYEMRRSNARALKQGAIEPVVPSRKSSGAGFELFSAFPSWTMSWLTLTIGVLMLVLAVPLFLLLPRLALGVYGRPPGPTRLVSGFSERVELGAIGTIKESDAVVMRVRPELSTGSLPADLKWRGLSLDYYDGRAWRRSSIERHPVAWVERRFFKIERSMQGTQLLEFSFFLEALSTDVVFAPHKVLAISNELGMLQRDNAGNLFTRAHPFNKIRYRSQSDVTPPSASVVWTQPTELPGEIRSLYLQLPPLDPRTADLAHNITYILENPFEKARALESYLRSTYAYSLELKGRPGHSDPLAMFLFEVKRGHCEYFATAMTIMLRQIGIPARLVNGFRSGEYNRFGNAFTVRQYDAHSWVEAYMAPYGWIEFDPTPADPAHRRPALTRVISDLIDAVNLWWWEGVVNYDVWIQFRMINSSQSALRYTWNTMQQLYEVLLEKARTAIRRTSDIHWSIFTLIIPFIILAVILCAYSVLHARFAWTTRLRLALRRGVSRRTPSSIAAAYYSEAAAILSALGFNRDRAQTPLEFAGTLAEHPAFQSVMELTRIYNSSRFGSPESPFDFGIAESRLNELRLACRKARQL